MKCKRFRMEHLRNEEWFQFYSEFKTVVEKHNPRALGIESFVSSLLSHYAHADEALELIRKSATTEQIADADQARDQLFRGFSDAIQSALKHFDNRKRDAARRLKIIFDQYGNLAVRSYDEETASIYNFLQEMNARASDVALLEVADWAQQLEMKNLAFDALMKIRYEEYAAKTTWRMKTIRAETDRCYRSILDLIDASVLIRGEEAYVPFIEDLNVRAERYKNLLAQRKGRALQNEQPDASNR